MIWLHNHIFFQLALVGHVCGRRRFKRCSKTPRIAGRGRPNSFELYMIKVKKKLPFIQFPSYFIYFPVCSYPQYRWFSARLHWQWRHCSLALSHQYDALKHPPSNSSYGRMTSNVAWWPLLGSFSGCPTFYIEAETKWTPFFRRHILFMRKKIYEFWLGFNWSMFLVVQLTMFQHWFR